MVIAKTTKLFFLTYVLLFFVTDHWSQHPATPDPKSSFTGEWVFDEKASKADRHVRRLYQDSSVLIRYEEPKFTKIEKRKVNGDLLTLTVVLYTDGRGETNPLRITEPDSKVESVTILKNNAIYRSLKITVFYNERPIGRINVSETYSLSLDSQYLTLTREVGPPDNQSGSDAEKESSIVTRIYRRIK
jgi:hypothetical protein